jgi:hypothetical protein
MNSCELMKVTSTDQHKIVSEFDFRHYRNVLDTNLKPTTTILHYYIKPQYNKLNNKNSTLLEQFQNQISKS